MRGVQSRSIWSYICQPVFHPGLKFDVYVVLEQYHLEVDCCNLPHIKWSRGSCNTLFLNHYFLKPKCMFNPSPSWKSSYDSFRWNSLWVHFMNGQSRYYDRLGIKFCNWLRPVSRTFFSRIRVFFGIFQTSTKSMQGNMLGHAQIEWEISTWKTNFVGTSY